MRASRVTGAPLRLVLSSDWSCHESRRLPPVLVGGIPLSTAAQDGDMQAGSARIEADNRAPQHSDERNEGERNVVIHCAGRYVSG